jgi:hypothetical protein
LFATNGGEAAVWRATAPRLRRAASARHARAGGAAPGSAPAPARRLQRLTPTTEEENWRAADGGARDAARRRRGGANDAQALLLQGARATANGLA